MSKLIYKQIVGDAGFREVRRSEDAEHWITVHPNGKENKGSPVLINGAGQIIGGAGGKLTGKFVKPKSKSKPRSGTEGQHAPAIWLGPAQKGSTTQPTGTGATHTPKPPEAPKPPEQPPAAPTGQNPHKVGTEEHYQFEKAKKVALSNKADELTKTAKTLEEHQAAMAAHEEAYLSWKRWNVAKSQAQRLNHHAAAYHEHKREVKRLEKAAKKGQPRAKKAATPEAHKVYQTGNPKEINDNLKQKYGLGFINGAGNDKTNLELYRARSQGVISNEEYQERMTELRSKIASDPGYHVRGHSSVDITKNNASAKSVRRLLGHVDNSMQYLESIGCDVKGIFSRVKVNFVAGSTGKALGHAWYARSGQETYFSLSTSKLEPSALADQRRLEDSRKARGLPRWGVGSDSADPVRAVIIHELTHAIGVPQSVDSPNRLAQVLKQTFPDKNGNEIMQWVRENISEYATKNIRETDAELAALVLDQDYQRGTLPKALEDHVDWLFKRRS